MLLESDDVKAASAIPVVGRQGCIHCSLPAIYIMLASTRFASLKIYSHTIGALNGKHLSEEAANAAHLGSCVMGVELSELIYVEMILNAAS